MRGDVQTTESIAEAARRRARRAASLVDAILANPALTFFSFFCFIPIVVFSPRISAETRLRLLGLWAGTIAIGACVRALLG